MWKIIPLILAATLLTGCNDEETHDVNWYKTHTTERATKLAACKNNP
jgi:hypothetical protein